MSTNASLSQTDEEKSTFDHKGREIKINQEDGRMYRILVTNGVQRRQYLCHFEKCESLGRKDGACHRHRNGTEGLTSKASLVSKINGSQVYSNQEFRDRCKNTNLIGDETEKFMQSLLKDLVGVEVCQRIGFTGDSVDLIYRLKGEQFYRWFTNQNTHKICER